jgi:4-hydroxy-3-methylbut-2-enyl diphosphate reductase IspH
VTQTTLSVDDTAGVIEALRLRFPNLVGPKKSDICYATQNRQDAVRALAAEADLLLVVGSANSSNSNRLRELAEKQGIPAYLIDGAEDISAIGFARALGWRSPPAPQRRSCWSSKSSPSSMSGERAR